MTTPRTVGILRNNIQRATDIIEDVDTILKDRANMTPPRVAELLGIKGVAENMAASLEGLMEDNRCSRDGGCVCGGDTPAVRAACSNWIK